MQLKELSGRLVRWALLLEQYDFEIIYCAGLQNGRADTLSRRPYAADIIAAIDSPGIQLDRDTQTSRESSNESSNVGTQRWPT